MRSTKALRLGAFISASALALSLGTVPSSAADESTQSFGTKSSVLDDRPSARLATGADLAGASASRSSASAEITAVPTANITKLKPYSGVLNNPTENYIDLDLWLSDATDVESIETIKLYLSVDGKKTSPYELWWDPELEVFFVVIPDTVGLGKAHFYGSMVYYYPELEKAATWDSTDSSSFYVRRDSTVDDLSYALSPSGKTKTFYIDGMKIYSPSLDGFTALSKIKLQYKTSDGWKTKKTIYLDDEGDGSYSFVRTTKFYYRLVYGTTSTFIGFNSGPTPKI